MKKIRKINLELNKEVISSLSNEDMSQMKGGVTSTFMDTQIKGDKGGCLACKEDPITFTQAVKTGCLNPASDNCQSLNCGSLACPPSHTCLAYTTIC